MTQAPQVLDAHGRHAQAVHFTRDKKHLVSCGQDARVRVWSLPGFRAERELAGHEKSIHSLSFSDDGKRLATASSDHTVRLWDFDSGECLHVFPGQQQGVLGPSGEHLATITVSGEVELWDTTRGTRMRTLERLDKRHLCLSFAPNGAFLFIGGSGPIHRVAVPDGTLDGRSEGHSIGVACLRNSPNGSVMASSGLDGTLRFWTVVGGDPVTSVSLPAPGALQFAFAPDGRSLAVGVEEAVLRLTAPDGQLIARHEVGLKGVYGVAFSPDGRWLANAAADGRVRVWELPRT